MTLATAMQNMLVRYIEDSLIMALRSRVSRAGMLNQGWHWPEFVLTGHANPLPATRSGWCSTLDEKKLQAADGEGAKRKERLANLMADRWVKRVYQGSDSPSPLCFAFKRMLHVCTCCAWHRDTPFLLQFGRSKHWHALVFCRHYGP